MKKRLITILLNICISSLLAAQSISFSRVGSVGSFPGGGYVASLATSFNHTTDCVKLNTGVTLFGGVIGRNDFFSICKPALLNSPIEFKLFPNPVINYTRLLATGLPTSLNQVYLIIVDMLGQTVRKDRIDAAVLRTGFSLHLSHLSAGNYFLRVQGSGLNQVIQFVKVH